MRKKEIKEIQSMVNKSEGNKKKGSWEQNVWLDWSVSW